jgi:hypothetical protein
MPRHLALSGFLLTLGLCGCGRDAPTEPQLLPPAPDAHLAPYVVALQDVRDRILPTFEAGAAVEELGSALGGLQAALVQPGKEAATLDAALARANAAAMGLRADTTLFADLDVVLIALEQIQIIAHRAVEPAP